MLKIGPSCFPLSPHIYSFLVCFKSQIVSIGAKLVFSQNCRDVTIEISKMLFLSVNLLKCWRKLEKDKQKKRKTQDGKRQKQTYKIVFYRWSSNEEMVSQLIATLIVFGRHEKAAFSCALFCFWPKTCLGEKETAKTRKHSKKQGFQWKLPKTKKDTFL